MTLSLEETKTIQLDRMRYTKNVFSSRMVYLAILFDVLYFVSVLVMDRLPSLFVSTLLSKLNRVRLLEISCGGLSTPLKLTSPTVTS